jgi:hypothetical protein
MHFDQSTLAAVLLAVSAVVAAAAAVLKDATRRWQALCVAVATAAAGFWALVQNSVLK